MSIARTLPALLALAVLAGACDTRESPQRREARREAHRDACIAEQLFTVSRSRMEDLDQVAATNDPMTASIARASAAYAQAYHRHATARLAILAHADSALAAETAADSTRHAQEAATHAEAAVAPGSVDDNVRQKYAQELTAAQVNPAHPCNAAEEAQ